MRILLCLTSSLLMTACSTFETPHAPAYGRTATTPVMTEHSLGLRCLGALIDQSPAPGVIVHVERIRDRTIPSRLNDESRLSQAGEWLIHTAIAKMESTKVRSTLKTSKSSDPGHILISGAWTQDDELVRRKTGDVDGQIGRFRFGIDADRSFDYVAGDFTTSNRGIVTFASAVGVMLASGDVGARLLVEDGNDSVDVSFDNRWADGPQFAQRRIAEAVTLIHLSRHYRIDYRPCLEAGWAGPSFFADAYDAFVAAKKNQQNRLIQEGLTTLGYDAGPVDGVWGAKSASALARYQSEHGLPITGRTSPVIYGLIAAKLSEKSMPQPITYKAQG